jgi:hypothetical protein
MGPTAPLLGSRPNRTDNPIYIDLLGPPAFYTSGNRVEGKLRVAPTSRPTHLTISLSVLSILHDTEANPVVVDLVRESQDLFIAFDTGEAFDLLRTSATKDGHVELPFSFAFPHTVTLPPPADRYWYYSKDSYNHPRFQHHAGFPLPPSCAGNTTLAPSIIHQLEAVIESPDSKSIKVRQEVRYLPPAPEFNPSLLQPDLNFGLKLPKHSSREKFIRTRKLLPGYEKSGKLGKIKDKLVDNELFFGLKSYSEVPYVKFNLFATPASVLVIGSRVPAVITVQHLQRSESLVKPPDLFLHRVKIQLNCVLNIFIPGRATAQQVAKESLCTATDRITLFDGKFEKADEVPLYDGLNILELAEVKLVNDKIVPSFTSYGLTLEHEVQIEIWGECADREFQGIACTQPVQIVTQWQVSTIQSGADGSLLLEADARPVYQEQDPMARIYETNPEREIREPEAPALEYELELRPMAAPSADRVPPPEYNV